MNFVIIYNPVAGKGKGKQKAHQLGDVLKNRQHRVSYLPTHPDPKEFTQQCKNISEAAIAVVVGGDGTLRHFVQCMPEVAGLAFYGMGTANVLRIELGYPKKISEFVQVLEQGNVCKFRPGLANHNLPFLMMYSFGADSYVLANVSQKTKNSLGKLAFLPPALKAIVGFRSKRVMLHMDKQTPIAAHFAIVSRIRHYAGPFVVAPTADPTSEHLQIVALNRSGTWPLLVFFLRLFLGNLKPNQAISMHSAREVRLEPEEVPVFAQMDGDPIGKIHHHLTVSNRVLPFIVPK